jgi:nucleoside-diphosphate-sugar epimerase
MQIAVTGGSGFVGRKLVESHLAAGDRVRVLTRRSADAWFPVEAEHVAGDLTRDGCDLSPFVRNADILYHCAGEIFDTSRMDALHLSGTRRLIEAASGCIGRWVQLSSVGAYGLVHRGEITEASVEHPVGTYEITKTLSDRQVLDASHTNAFGAAILRPCKILGVGMRDASVSQMITFIARKLFFFIGPQGAAANYVSVENVVHGLRLCGTDPAAVGHVYNLSDTRTLEAFVSRIAGALGVDTPTWRVPERLARSVAAAGRVIPGFPLTQGRINGLTSRATYPIARIVSDLGYRHLVSIEQELDSLVHAWEQRRG